jgi:DNA-binding response OmpR family regulator
MPAKKTTILVVDGDALHRESMRQALRASGYRVLEAGDFRGGINAHQQHPGQVDILITALSLPGGNGYELSKTILEAEPNMKVLFVSGEAGAKISEFYSEPSAEACTLRRPFERSKLLKRIRDLLQLHRSSSALA